MIYSEEQNAIFKFAKNGIQNMIIQAVAGAGKTTTLVECANQIGADKRILMLAHNRSAKDNLKEKTQGKSNIKVYTLHGLAYRLYQEHFNEEPNIESEKYRLLISKNPVDVFPAEYFELSQAKKNAYRANVLHMVDMARHNLKQSAKEIKKLGERKYGIEFVANEYAAAANVLKWGLQHRECVDYQDLLWYPSEFGYFTKKYLADIIILDEAQDASLAQQDVVSRCFKRNTRLFAAGDESQSINSWCGADTEAFNHLKDSTVFRKDVVEFPLTTNYRCGRKIIEYARQYTDNDIKPCTTASEGDVRFNVKLDAINEGDMVLCRNMSPLMQVYRWAIRRGKKAYFKGDGLGTTLKESIKYCTNGDSVPEIIFSLKCQLIAEVDKLIKDDGTIKDAVANSAVISLLDTIKTMENLPEDIQTREQFMTFADEVFSTEYDGGVQLSTIHRAKGLEANNVFVVCPSLIPSKLVKLDWEKEEEKHLQYVMSTRAKDTLNFVTEKDIKAVNFFSEKGALYNEIKTIKNEILSVKGNS